MLPLRQEIEGSGRPVAEQENEGLLPATTVVELGEDVSDGDISIDMRLCY